MDVFFLDQTIENLTVSFGRSKATPAVDPDILGMEGAVNRVTRCEQIPDSLSQDADGWVVCCRECSSSLDVARYLQARGRFPVWASVLCGRQWAGRGQKNRRWISPSGNLYAALHWPIFPPPWDRGIHLWIGYLTIRFMARMNVYLKLKWPNDLVSAGNKVGGILIEQRNGLWMVGFGLNIESSPCEAALRREHAMTAGHLGDVLPRLPVLSLWKKFVDFCRSAYDGMIHSGQPSEVLRQVEALLAYRNRAVRIVDGEFPIRGYILGLTENGGLRLSCGKDEQVVYSGSIVPMEGRG